MPKRDIEAANLPTRARPDLTELAKLIMRATRMGIKVALPGRVVSYNATTQLANVSTEILAVQLDPVLGVEVPQLPLVLVDVPVVFPSNGAGAYLTFPITPGVTTGQLLVNDRNIGRWLNVGTPTDPSVATSHKLEDAVFLPGLHAKTNPLPDPLGATVLENPTSIKLGAAATLAAARATDPLTAPVAPAGGGMAVWATAVEAALVAALSPILPAAAYAVVLGAVPGALGTITSGSAKTKVQ